MTSQSIICADRTVVPRALDHFRGSPLNLRIEIPESVSLAGVDALVCGIFTGITDPADEALASVELAVPSPLTSRRFIFPFTTVEMTLPMEGRARRDFWAMVYARVDGEPEPAAIDTLVAVRLLVAAGFPSTVIRRGESITPPLTGSDDPRGGVGAFCWDQAAGQISFKVSIAPHLWIGGAGFNF